MPLSLLNHSALALFAQRTRIPTSARSIGFCAIWVCISSSSKFGLFAKSVRVLEVTSLSVVLHRSASVSAARNTTRLANKSLRVPRKKVKDELRARGLRANFAHLITRNYL